MALPAIQPRTEIRTSYGVLSGLPEGRVSPEVEKKLLDAGDKEGLVLHSLWEAFIYARECSHGRDSDGQILSVCYSALQQAIRRFDPNFGTRFFAYAKPFVRGELKQERRRLRVIRPGKAKEDPHACIGFEEWRQHVIQAHENDNTRGDANYQNPLVVKRPNSAFTPKPGFEMEVDADVDAGDRKALWAEFYALAEKHLSARALRVIKLHLEDGLGWQEIADKVGYSREAQRALFEKSIKRLASFSGQFSTLLKYEHLRG